MKDPIPAEEIAKNQTPQKNPPAKKNAIPAKEVYEFYVELMDFKPKIWRRFYVSSDMTMEKLAFTIMHMFNMQGGHLFDFKIDMKPRLRKEFLSRPEINKKMVDEMVSNFPNLIVESYIDEEMDAADDEFTENVLKQTPPRRYDASTTKIKNIIKKDDECIFTYDFGDNWQITVVLEDTDAKTGLSKSELPLIKEGKNFGIIEDCGSIPGLEGIVKAFEKKKGEDYEEYKNWLGIDDFDIHSFDKDELNSSVKSFIRYMTRAYNENREEW